MSLHIPKEFEIRIPASTSNIGPGFDCLGLAFSLYNRIRIHSLPGTKETIEFCFSGPYASQVSDLKQNLYIDTLSSLCLNIGQDRPSLSINFEVNIPVYRGLGSSANAVLAAYLTVRTLFNLRENQEAILSRLFPFEGHPDNLTPSLTGGLTVSCLEESRVYFKKHEIHNNWSYLLLVPDFYISTESARSILPADYSRDQIIFSLSRLPLLVDAFLTGDSTRLRIFLRDTIHHPYRTRLIPFYSQIEEAAYNYGASGVALSGSGSAIVIIIPGNINPNFQENLLAILQEHNLRGEIFTPRVDNQGAVVDIFD